jgi:hypothetical protein
MEDLIPILIVLGILFIFVTLVGHGIWLILAWIFRELTGTSRDEPPVSITPSPTDSSAHKCPNCGFGLTVQLKFCGVCGARRPTPLQQEVLRELDITLRQLERLHDSGAMTEVDFRVLKTKIVNERDRILFPNGRPGLARQPSLFTPEATAASRGRPAQPPSAAPQLPQA